MDPDRTFGPLEALRDPVDLCSRWNDMVKRRIETFNFNIARGPEAGSRYQKNTANAKSQ